MANGMWCSGDMVLVEVKKLFKSEKFKIILCARHTMGFCHAVDSLIALHRYKSLGVCGSKFCAHANEQNL